LIQKGSPGDCRSETLAPTMRRYFARLVKFA
jgi:hypothetical protein